jgi:hypothetical protein
MLAFTGLRELLSVKRNARIEIGAGSILGVFEISS